MAAFNAEPMLSPARASAMGAISAAPAGFSGRQSPVRRQRDSSQFSTKVGGRRQQWHRILLLPYFKAAMECDGLSAEEIHISSSEIPASQAPGTDDSGSQRIPDTTGNREKWSLADVLVLVQAKKEEDQKAKLIPPGSRKQSQTSSRKWINLKERMAELGVERSVLQLRKRWDRLMADFKKVHDYERNIPSGYPSYFQQDRAKRKEMNLPNDLPHDVYDAMVTWVVAHRNIVPDPRQIIETDDLETTGPDATPVTPSTPPSPVPNSPASAFESGGMPSREGSSPLTEDPFQPTDDPWISSVETPDSGPSIPGVTSHYERFGQKRSRKSIVDAEVRATVMPRMIEQMNKGLEAHRETTIAQSKTSDAMLKLKEKEIDSQKESAAALSNSMDRIAQSIEFLARHMVNRMAREQ